MRRLLASGALVLVVAAAAGAQTLLASVSQRLSPNDTVFVTTKNTGETRGVFVSASSAMLVISAKGRQEQIPVADVIAIDKPGDPVWGGAIIGGAILGLGFMGGAGASCSPNCATEVPVATAGGVAIGGAIGAVLDYLHRGRTRVYRAPVPRGAPPQPLADRPVTTPPVATDLPREAAGSFGTLWERVKPGDSIAIVLSDGRQLDGKFSRASDSAIAVSGAEGVQEFPAAGVRRVVRKKGGDHGRRGLLIGASVGALFGTGPCYRVDPVMYPADSGMSCGTGVLIGAVAGGAVGFALGRTVWRRTLVYEAPDATAAPGGDSPRASSAKRVDLVVAPLFSRRRIGIAGTVTFAGGLPLRFDRSR